MSVIYRRMTLEDVPQVHEIEMKTFHTPWTYQSFVDEMTTNKCARYIVAEEDGKILGYAGAWLVFDEGHQVNLLIDRDVLSLDEVGMHPLKNNASIAMKTDDLLHKYFVRTGHEPQILDIPEEVEA